MLIKKHKITDYIYTILGHAIYPEEMKVEQIVPHDIAFALSGIYRYNGHTRISVLRHSLAIYGLLRRDGETERTCAFGLLHDAPEAYIMDIPVPQKKYMRKSWKGAHDHIEQRIFQYFGFNPGPTPQERSLVHFVDKEVVEYEMNNPLGDEQYVGKGKYRSLIGMFWPGRLDKATRPRRYRFIEEAYQWHLSEEDLIEQFLSLCSNLEGRLLVPEVLKREPESL